MSFDAWEPVNLNRMYLDSFWDFYSFLKDLFEVKDIPNLARLSYSQPIFEPFPPVVSHGILDWVGETNIKQVRTDESASAALAPVAVDRNYVLIVRWKKIVHGLTSTEKCD